MAIEADIVTALNTLFGNRVFPDTADQNTPRPFCIYQHIGGVPISTFCGEPVRKNEVLQFTVWGENRVAVNALMRQMAAILTAAPLYGVSQGGFVGIYDEPTRSRGARQDFSFWR